LNLRYTFEVIVERFGLNKVFRRHIDSVSTVFAGVLAAFVLAAASVPASYLALSSLKPNSVITGAPAIFYEEGALALPGKEVTIRLDGVAWPKGAAAAAADARFLELAKSRTLSCTRQRPDPHREFLARCVDAEGNDLARALILEGFAREDCWESGGHYGGCRFSWSRPFANSGFILSVAGNLMSLSFGKVVALLDLVGAERLALPFPDPTPPPRIDLSPPRVAGSAEVQ
jgi:endonuclease YncB( thermonuclease family)